MDRIFIKDLLVRGIIGVHDRERERPQDILINITVFADTARAAATDNVGDSVDYSALARAVQTLAETAARRTVEALAGDLARLCLEQKGVSRAIVRVEKPGAVRFAASVGVEVDRRRDA